MRESNSLSVYNKAAERKLLAISYITFTSNKTVVQPDNKGA